MLLVILEHDRGAMAEAAREALTFGRTLAGRMGVPLHAALVGSKEAALVAEAGTYGAAVATPWSIRCWRTSGPRRGAR